MNLGKARTFFSEVVLTYHARIFSPQHSGLGFSDPSNKKELFSYYHYFSSFLWIVAGFCVRLIALILPQNFEQGPKLRWWRAHKSCDCEL
jgi:hypothetical protein